MAALKKFLILPVFIFLLCQPLKTMAEAAPDLETETARLVRNAEQKKFLSLSIENDSLGDGSDHNYTSGVRVTYFNINANIPSFIDAIADYVPTFDINDTTAIAYSFGQNLYTPGDIEAREQDPDDRPWAGWIYASAGLATLTDDHIDELELTIGIVGPAALGEFSQKYIHSLINSVDPNGWGNQLDNEPGLIVSWLRRWPEMATFEALSLYGALEPNFNISLGNVYTYAGAGFTVKLGPLSGRWQDTPPRVRPAVPGTGYFSLPQNDWSWHVFAGVDGRAIARNIFLDGNTFSDSHSVDKKHFVADLNTGVALTYRQMRISYSLVYRTEEFARQDDGSLFGSLTLSYRY